MAITWTGLFSLWEKRKRVLVAIIIPRREEKEKGKQEIEKKPVEIANASL